MKIKNDFVTNSSSISFIIAAEKKILRKELEFSFIQYESFRSFDNLEALITHAQDRKCDWVDMARGSPKEFVDLGQDEFEAMKEIISNGWWAYRVYIERNNWDRVERFKQIISELPFETNITLTESY